ncbi:hypothetical protein [Caldalkalibacillus salinus]|uniref:hypothetical protein n=1 Tax=Caldalkalibacillus salinus TaxID=2803787 RepID=UPI001924B50F|nr:hypothetical protein [Caldalkalibacillus salinus]
MHHRYYGVCRANIGREADIRTVDGRRLHGQLVGVTPSGVRLSPTGRGITDKDVASVKGVRALDTKGDKTGDSILFFPFFVPFAAITALTFAAAATAPFRFRRRRFRRRFFY